MRKKSAVEPTRLRIENCQFHMDNKVDPLAAKTISDLAAAIRANAEAISALASNGLSPKNSYCLNIQGPLEK